jgi:ATP-dependent exoDNAse (exonuclease V) beta subunit
VSFLLSGIAKGLQWHTVILTSCNEGLIPHQLAPVEEERRLFYVAMTRASSNLVLSYVRNACSSRVAPSRFLYEAGLLGEPARQRGLASPRTARAAMSSAAGRSPSSCFFASGRSRVFHAPDCESIETIEQRNLVQYATRDEALRSGKSPCSRCEP